MSLTQYLNTVPYSLTGIQNAGTVNGNTPCDSITILSQTTFLSSSPVDINGNINLTLSIPSGTSVVEGINYDLKQTNNIFTGSQDWTNTNLKMTLNTDDTGFHVGYNPATRAITYNSDASSNILGSNNIFTGTNQFNSNILFGSGNIYMTNLGTTIQPYFIAFNPSTGLITYNSTSALSILGTNNVFTAPNEFTDLTFKLSGISLTAQTYVLGYNNVSKQVFYQATGADLTTNNVFSGTNYFTNVDIKFSGLTSSSDASFLRYNNSTGQISKSLISTLSILPLNNTFSGNNTFSSVNTIFNSIIYCTNSIRALTLSCGPDLGGIGGLSIQQANYTPATPAGWNDDYALFGVENSLGGGLLSDSFCLAICQSDANTNNIISLKPQTGFKDLNITGRNFSVKAGTSSLMSLNDNFIYNYYGNTGNVLSYIASWNLTTLVWIIYRNAAGTGFGYYDTLTNTLGTASDQRIKRDIKKIDINKSKEFIISLSPSTFRFIEEDNPTKIIGFIAQDILKNAKTEAQKNIVSNWKIYEEAVSKGEEPMEEYEDNNDKDVNGIPKTKKRPLYLGVSAMSIIPELVGCIQSQNKEIESLKERLSKIEKLLDLS